MAERAELKAFLEKCQYFADMPDRYGNKSSAELLQINKAFDELFALEQQLTDAREENKRLREAGTLLYGWILNNPTQPQNPEIFLEGWRAALNGVK